MLKQDLEECMNHDDPKQEVRKADEARLHDWPAWCNRNDRERPIRVTTREQEY
jgi:hypothetical protein